MSERKSPAVAIPNEMYAFEWVNMFKSTYPELKDQAREIFLRLIGQPSWQAMSLAFAPGEPLVEFDELPVEDRLNRSSRMRELLVNSFGMRADVANHVSWMNPPGFSAIWELYSPEFSVVQDPNVHADHSSEFLSLDALNRARCLGTSEADEIIHWIPDAGAHLGLLKHLQWQFEALVEPTAQISSLDNSRDEYLEPIGFVLDADLGKVPVFVTRCRVIPGWANDQVYSHILKLALATAELLAGVGSPALVLHNESTSRLHDDHYYTCFGSIIHNDCHMALLLNQGCSSLSDVLVNLTATDFNTPGIERMADTDLRLQKMFERARQKHLLENGDIGKLFRSEGPGGWSGLTLCPSAR